jgi:hypothetical protein
MRRLPRSISKGEAITSQYTSTLAKTGQPGQPDPLSRRN